MILKCLKNNNLRNPVKEAKFKPGKSSFDLTENPARRWVKISTHMLQYAD
jgi:hypothetical protein